MWLQADTDLAMLMLESSSSANEAATRLDSIRQRAEASKQASDLNSNPLPHVSKARQSKVKYSKPKQS